MNQDKIEIVKISDEIYTVVYRGKFEGDIKRDIAYGTNIFRFHPAVGQSLHHKALSFIASFLRKLEGGGGMTIQRMSDEEIDKKIEEVLQTGGTIDDYCREIFRAGESLHLPQLEKMQEEIERLKKDLELTGYIDFEVARGNWYDEKLKLIAEISSLNTQHEALVNGQRYLQEDNERLNVKHEKLVKGLKALPVSMIDPSPVRMFDSPKEPFIHKPFIDELLTESEGE